MKKIILLLIPVLLLTGCELVNEKRDRDEAITECKNAGETPYVRNYSDSRYRPIVNCIFDKEEKE
jgi:hypothetical protein|nr:MAG TPA: conotoxin [Caudoviricetes sp.]